MKKFLYFVKRRFCPVMLALLVMFFSAVIPASKVEASPAPVLPPTFEVIPGGAPSGLTYFDLFSSLFIPAGVDVKMVSENGYPKSFDQQLWEEICDTFELWAEDNISDFKELGAELEGLAADAADGIINVSKKLFEAVQQYGKEAADWVKSHTVDKSQLIDGEYISLDYIDSLTGGSFSDYFIRTYSESSFLSYKKDFDSSKYKYFILCREQYKISGFEHDIYLFFYDRYYPNYYVIPNSSGGCYSFILTDASGTYGGGFYPNRFPAIGSYFIRDNASYYPYTSGTPIIATNMTQVVKPASPSDPVSPVQPPYPVSHIVFTPRPDPVTWPDYVASVVTNPDSLADSVPVPVPHRDPATGIIIDPDPDPDPIPVPDPVPDPDPDPEPDPEPDPDADEKVDPEQIAGLPDKITAAGDVTKLFPFCIPFDIIALVKSMKAEKAPPVWHFEFYFDQINYKFEVTVDMTQYEGYVKIFRSGFVILYIITLMLLTVRYSSGIAKD